MSEHEVNVMCELLQIFVTVNEDDRTRILDFAQNLIEHPDLSGRDFLETP